MDTIDWNKPIESDKGWPASLVGPIGNVMVVSIKLNDKQWAFYVSDAAGNVTKINEDGVSWNLYKIRNRPPAPAPAACEHNWENWTYDINGDIYRCSKCGTKSRTPLKSGCTGSLPPPSPSPAPEPSERIASEIAADTTDRYSPRERDFYRAYAVEQSSQRKAAGELQEKAVALAKYYDGSYPAQAAWYALAADAALRAGKDGGK